MSSTSISLRPLHSIRQNSISTPNVRQAVFEDYDQIAALHERHGFSNRGYEEWRNLWIENPLYRELEKWAIGWVLEDKSKTIVGYLGNIPLPYLFQGRPIIAATSKAWIVDPSFRSYSFLLLSHFFGQSQVQLFINNTVNEQAVKGYEAFRVQRVPVGAWDQSVFWITNYRGFAASLLSAGKCIVPKKLRFAVSLGLRAQDKLTMGRSNWRSSSVSPMFVNSFDGRFERFWQLLQCSRSNVLLAVRSPQILDWHFHRALAEGRAWVLAVTDKSELVAYAIFLRRDNRAFGLTRLRLIDFQSCERKDELIGPILSAALGQCRREGVHMLEIVGLKSSQLNMLDRRGLRRRVLPSWMFFYKTNDSHLAKALTDPRSWEPSCFDGDASL